MSTAFQEPARQSRGGSCAASKPLEWHDQIGRYLAQTRVVLLCIVLMPVLKTEQGVQPNPDLSASRWSASFQFQFRIQ